MVLVLRETHYSDEGIKERHVHIVNKIYNITVERMAKFILLGYQVFFPLSPSFLNAILKKQIKKTPDRRLDQMLYWITKASITISWSKVLYDQHGLQIKAM